MGTGEHAERVETPCDRAHLDQLRAPDSDIAVPSNPAALESVAALLAHRRSVGEPGRPVSQQAAPATQHNSNRGVTPVTRGAGPSAAA